jgi:hypothetical protein
MGLRQLHSYAAKYSQGLDRPLQLGTAPASGASGSYLGRAAIGALLVDTSTGKLYACTASTGSSITWTLVGAQT